ncbi:MAG: extracellular solute-binding protein [Victivallaceae bacterium]|nr:extracellular solute-binding protein [Victivallaceae bacterium]
MRKKYMPLYIKIKSNIINRIISGELKRGDRLPPERELAEEFDVSRITVVGALSELVSEGIIKKIRGSGSYIDCDDVDEDYNDIFSHISSTPTTEITFGIRNPSPQYELLLKTLAGLFHLENSEIKVKVERIPLASNADEDIYLAKINSGKTPTVGEFILHADYAAVDGLEPLENMPDFQRLLASLHPKCVYKTVNADNEKHIHALPMQINARVVIANVDLLRQAGIDPSTSLIDRATLLEWVTKLGRYTRTIQPDHYGVYVEIPEGWHCIIGNFPYLWSGQCRNSLDGFIKMLSSDYCLNGLNFLAELIKVGNPAYQNAVEMFAIGRVGLLVNGSTWPIMLHELLPQKVNMKAFFIPSDEKNKPIPSVLGSSSVGIFSHAIKNDAERDAAWQWIKFLFRKKQQYLLSENFTYPTLTDVPSIFQTSRPDLHQVFSQATINSIPQFDFKNLRHTLNIFGGEMKQCLTDKITAEQCIENTLDALKRNFHAQLASYYLTH